MTIIIVFANLKTAFVQAQRKKKKDFVSSAVYMSGKYNSY